MMSFCSNETQRHDGMGSSPSIVHIFIFGLISMLEDQETEDVESREA